VFEPSRIRGRSLVSNTVSPPLLTHSALPHRAARPDFDIDTLKLLHFYTTTTSLTLYTLPQRQRIWSFVVPQIAFSHQFLLHGLLAIAALQFARLQPALKNNLLAEAASHHQNALALFRSVLLNITAQNCDACFAFSSFLVIYAWASSDGAGDLFFTNTSRLEQDGGTVEWVQLLRGAKELLKTFWNDMEKGPLQTLLKLWDGADEPPAQVSPKDDGRFLDLMRLWDSPHTHLSAEEVEALDEALTLLRQVYGLMPYFETKICAISATFSWPVQVPEAYIEMVKRRQPEALVLLAHYCLLLNTVNNFWWIHGMSRHLLENIHRNLGTDWESWIAWPLQDLVLSEFKRPLVLTEYLVH